MLSYKRIRKISEMFDSNIQINININDHMMETFDADMDWSYNALNFPSVEFYQDQFDFGIEDEESQLSPQIRNHDCMWSGRCTTHPNECLNSRNNCNKKYVNEKSAQQNQQQTQSIKQEPQQNAALLLQQKAVQQKKQQNIPAGQSLLRLKHVKPTAIRVPNITTNDFLNNRDFIVRPDTPLSLDDDPPEFKHNIDLAACTVGSNKMSLIEDSVHGSPTEIINILKEHLEDTSSNRAPKVGGYMSSISADSDGLDEIINDIKSLSDFENESEDEEAEESDATNDSFNVSDTMVSIPTQNPASVKNTITAYDIAQSMHSDHSYTRSKSRVDVIGLGVQTPSDSGTFKFIQFLLNPSDLKSHYNFNDVRKHAYI